MINRRSMIMRLAAILPAGLVVARGSADTPALPSPTSIKQPDPLSVHVKRPWDFHPSREPVYTCGHDSPPNSAGRAFGTGAGVACRGRSEDSAAEAKRIMDEAFA